MDMRTKIEYMKLDIFNNADINSLKKNKLQLHAKLSIKFLNTTGFNQYSSGLNSPIRLVKRGMDLSDLCQRMHYEKILEIYQATKLIDVSAKASKFYISGQQKGRTVIGLSLVYAYHHNLAQVILGDDVIEMALTGDALTTRQRQKNMIASGEWFNPNAAKLNTITIWDIMGDLS